jgi:nucleoside-diphosphate-sugar epimerase
VLFRSLLDAGYKVSVIDRFYFGDNFGDLPNLEKITADSRDFDPSVLEGAFAVLDLAAISNDPAGDLDRQKTLDINYRARRRLQELCVELGVERYILASSCSVYGFQDNIVNENSQVNPLTTYAEANLLAEASAMSLVGEGTIFTAFRQATVYGLSPRMRFDLVVNAMSLNVVRGNALKMLRDGSQWRPLVHVRDTSMAFIACLSTPGEAVDGQTINIGANSHNFQVLEIAKDITSALKVGLDIEWYGDPDLRSYKVSFDKAAEILNFKPEWSLGDAALEIQKAYASGILKDDLKTNTLAWYKEVSDMESVLEKIRLSRAVF